MTKLQKAWGRGISIYVAYRVLESPVSWLVGFCYGRFYLNWLLGIHTKDAAMPYLNGSVFNVLGTAIPILVACVLVEVSFLILDKTGVLQPPQDTVSSPAEVPPPQSYEQQLQRQRELLKQVQKN